LLPKGFVGQLVLRAVQLVDVWPVLLWDQPLVWTDVPVGGWRTRRASICSATVHDGPDWLIHSLQACCGMSRCLNFKAYDAICGCGWTYQLFHGVYMSGVAGFWPHINPYHCFSGDVSTTRTLRIWLMFSIKN
jgi:hypothetical protein